MKPYIYEAKHDNEISQAFATVSAVTTSIGLDSHGSALHHQFEAIQNMMRVAYHLYYEADRIQGLRDLAKELGVKTTKILSG